MGGKGTKLQRLKWVEKQLRAGNCRKCGQLPPIEGINRRTGKPFTHCEACLLKARLEQVGRRSSGRYKTAQKEAYAKKRNEVLAHYGNVCACCEEDETVFLEVDHVQGGGETHRRIEKITNIYYWLVKNNYPEGFQLLCSNCNLAKWRVGICPHQKGK